VLSLLKLKPFLVFSYGKIKRKTEKEKDFLEITRK